MTTRIQVPDGMFPVSATAGAVTTNGGVTLDAISCKDAEMVYLHIHLLQAVGHATAFTPLCGSVVATTATALPNDVEIWYGNTTTAVTTLAKQTAAKLFTIGVGVTGACHILFKIDPAILATTSTAATTYDCLGGTIANSAQVTNLVSAVWWIVPRYQNSAAANAVTRFIVD